MADLSAGAADFAALSRRLKDAGEVTLRRELYKAISDAARPLGAEIRDPGHLKPYVPSGYAATLGADLAVTTSKLTGRDPGVRIVAKGRVKKRKVQQLDAGVISHPLFGDRKRWFRQTAGMRAGFFSDPAEKSAPQIRDAVVAAMRDVASKITKG